MPYICQSSGFFLPSKSNSINHKIAVDQLKIQVEIIVVGQNFPSHLHSGRQTYESTMVQKKVDVFGFSLCDTLLIQCFPLTSYIKYHPENRKNYSNFLTHIIDCFFWTGLFLRCTRFYIVSHFAAKNRLKIRTIFLKAVMENLPEWII